MYTINNSPGAVMPLTDDRVVVKGFPCADPTALKVGTVVKLLSTGLVAAVSASTDVPFGIVSSNYTADDAGTVRVRTFFQATVRCIAYGDDLDEGDAVSAVGFDSTENIPRMSPAGTGDWVVGVCITAGDEDEEALIGLYYSPRQIPA